MFVDLSTEVETKHLAQLVLHFTNIPNIYSHPFLVVAPSPMSKC